LSFLVDTNVISALAPSRAERPQALLEWLEQNADRLFLSAVTAAEIRAGIAKATREGAHRKAENLAAWWSAIEHLYGARILAFDLKAATLAGEMADRAKASGASPGFADIAIAATAAAHDHELLTRNLRHFAPLYDKVFDPFDQPPQ
jgi:predicted nucleic acid-binding protein